MKIALPADYKMLGFVPMRGPPHFVKSDMQKSLGEAFQDFVMLTKGIILHTSNCFSQGKMEQVQ